MLNAKSPHFLEGFNPSSSSERLKIPSKFIKYLEGRTRGTATLVGPSGNTWYADLIQHDDGIFFGDGWTSFVRDHSLLHGDSLVFRYDGDLHFKVKVFDETSCQKENAFNAECSQDPSNFDRRMGKRRERELLDIIVNGVPKKMRSSHTHSECRTKNEEDNLEVDDNQGCFQEGVLSVTERCQAAGISNNMENCECPLKNSVTIAVRSAEATVTDRTSKEDELNSYASVSTSLLLASEAEIIVRSFASCFPNFTKVMKRFNISGSYTLNVPYQFSMAHLPNCKVKIVLRNLKGESWTVNSIPTTRVQTSHTFCGGWLAFVRDNNINLGDRCIFELVCECELRVRILRVGNEGLDCQSSKAAHKGLIKGIDAASSKTSRRVPKKMRVIRKKTSSQEKNGSQTKGCMSMKSDPEEKMAAQSFVTSFPYFVRSMKKFNISGSYTLKIPYRFSMQHIPNCKTEIALRNLKGECWSVNSIPNKKVQTLHTFCGGWMAFVRDNDIQIGDICIFELVDKYEMRVHIYPVAKNWLDFRNGKEAAAAAASTELNSPLL